MLRTLLRLLPVAVLVAWQLAVAAPAHAKADDLDRSFGTGGTVTTDFYGFTDHAQAGLIIQPDGKLVAAGASFTLFTGGNYDFALARYNPNGTLDRTFGRQGKVTTDFAGGDNGAVTLAMQADGKLVAGGFAAGPGGYDWALARYRA
jgi:uncharacterized delta-60 repeat protein